MNLREDVPDAAANHDVSRIEAHFGRALIESEQLGVSLFRYEPNFRAPFGHHHREQEEAYVVVSGSGRMKLGDELIDLRRWDVVRVAPEVMRGIQAGPDGLELIVVGGPRPEEGDGELDPDWWPVD
jgi:mannose-6-phosphate isomerase-like protein (cupin superfamily)